MKLWEKYHFDVSFIWDDWNGTECWNRFEKELAQVRGCVPYTKGLIKKGLGTITIHFYICDSIVGGVMFMGKKDVLLVDKNVIAKNKNLKYPGDKVTQIITPKGDVVTKLDTKEKKATHRQYMKKNGTPGKQTMIIMQTDNDENF